ncbi:MAG TPA: GspH/FimT family pseudopilin [Candidatus Eisenbacteria bacterium]|nr:GspH/FimT family pseudopilin [Candidatus Eisenbacteria bacterium]
MQGRRGTTLLEAVIALALGSIVAATASARLATIASALELASSARGLGQALRMVRAQAIAEGAALDATFDAASGTWSIQDAGGATRSTTALPAPVGFASLPVRRRIRFGSTGTAENGTVVLAADGRDASIIVNQRGRVRLQ